MTTSTPNYLVGFSINGFISPENVDLISNLINSIKNTRDTLLHIRVTTSFNILQDTSDASRAPIALRDELVKLEKLLDEKEEDSASQLLLVTTDRIFSSDLEETFKLLDQISGRTRLHVIHIGNENWLNFPGNSLNQVEAFATVSHRKELQSQLEKFERHYLSDLEAHTTNQKAHTPQPRTTSPQRPQIALDIQIKPPEPPAPAESQQDGDAHFNAAASTEAVAEVPVEKVSVQSSDDQEDNEPSESETGRIWRRRNKFSKAKNQVEGDNQSEKIRDEVAVKRAVNGQPIIGQHSRINSERWIEKDWARLSTKKGPARDFECEYGIVGDLCVVGGSVRGGKHRLYGDENQDAFAIRETSRFTVFAVCDGVSSAEYAAYTSRQLSQTFVNRAGDELQALAPDTDGNIPEIIARSIKYASDAIMTWDPHNSFSPPFDPTSVTDEEKLKLLASTICCGVVTNSFKNDQHTIWLQTIGDSPAYQVTGSTWSVLAGETKESEVLTHSTDALPSPNIDVPKMAAEVLEVKLNKDSQFIAVTDGISTSVGSGDNEVAAWIGDRMKHLATGSTEKELWDLLAFDRKGEDDDRTAVVIFNKRNAAGRK